MNKLITALLFVTLLQFCLTGSVQDHGLLKVQGNRVVDHSGKSVVLRGMSLFWSQWGDKWYNEQTIDWLVSDWNINLVRCAMAVDKGGYLDHPDQERAKVETVIQAAIKNDIYVIVDWHTDQNPYTEQAKSFFRTMAQKWGSHANIIWETYNEPLISWPEIKAHHEAVIHEIRQFSQNLVSAGTPNWSQDVDVAARDPVNDANTAYTLHFYAPVHKQSFRDKAENAMNMGKAIFITEWGTGSDAGLDLNESAIWLNWCTQHGISNANWGVYDKNEPFAALKPGASGTGGWPQSMLTEDGQWVRNYIVTGKPGNTPTPPSGSGCCSWDGGNSCGQTSDWCAHNKTHCINECQGTWKPDGMQYNSYIAYKRFLRTSSQF